MQHPFPRLRCISVWFAALLVAGAFCVPVTVWASEPEVLVIPVAASDSTFEEGVLVTWPQAGTDSVFYRVYRDSVLLSYLPSGASAYLDTSAVVRTTYEYCVHLYDVGTDSEIDLGCDTGTRAFLKPYGVAASDGAFTDRVRVTWIDRSRIETGYEIWRQEPDSTWVLAGTTVADRGTFDDTGATPGVTYTYCVNAIRGSDVSMQDCDTGLCSYILAPASLEASDGLYTDRVVLTWEDRSDNETAFEITRDAAVIDSVPAGSTSYEDLTGLGVERTYCVKAVNDTTASPQVCDEGIGGDSTMVAPGNVEATYDEFDDRVEITWEDSTDTEDGFDIYRGASLIASVYENTTAYTDSDAPPGVAASYAVVAVSDHGGSSRSASAMGRRSLIIPPTDVAASDGSFEAYAEISWESASTTVVLFTFSRDGVPIKTAAGTDRSVRDYDIAPGTDYDYCVWGVTAMGDTSLHVCDTGRRELKPPTFVSATDDTLEDRIAITWTDVSSVETGYRIYRRYTHPDSTAVVIGTTPANRTLFEDEACASGITYEYNVVAYDARGESAAGTDTGSRVLLAPTSVEATDGEFEDRVKVTWRGASYAESGYRIYRKGPADSVAVLVGTTDEFATEFTDPSPEFTVDYTYYVAAYDAWGESDRDWDHGFTTTLPPSWVNASDFYDDRVVITWVDESRIETGYQILRDQAVIAQTGPDVTTFTDSPPKSDVTYWYCVRTFTGEDVVVEYAGSYDIPGEAWSYGVAISGDYAYVADGDSGLYVIDIRDPSNPAHTGNCDTPDFAFSVAVSGDYAYVADRDSGLQVIDISNPASPTIAGSYNTPEQAIGVAISGDYAYVACLLSGLQVIDISNPASPALAGSYDTPGSATCVAVSGDYAYVADYDLGLQVIDIDNPTAPTLAGSYDTPGYSWGVAVSGDYAYVADSNSGLQVIDIGNPADPTYMGSYDTPGDALDIAVSGNLAYVADVNSGLQVIDIGDPADPTYVGSYDTPGDAYGVAVRSGHAYVADGSSGLQVIRCILLIDMSSDEICDAGMRPSPLPEPEVPVVGVMPQYTHGDFGEAVAMDGDFMIVGAPNSTGGEGDAYIFERDGADWVEVYRHGESGQDSSRFGWSVAMSGDLALVGNPEHDTFRGAVHVISRDEYGAWTESAVLTASGGIIYDNFGYSVALDGDLAIVGAPGRSVSTGAAYIFKYDGAMWAEEALLMASGGASGDEFGHGVAIDGRVAVVGAPLHTSKGAAYIYSYSGGVWTETYTCAPASLEPDAYFGGSVAIDGDFAVIGAPTVEGNAGATYVFRRYVDTWELTDELDPPWDALPSPWVGAGSCDVPTEGDGVAVSGNYAYVAAYTAGLQVIDISNAASPTLAGSCDTPERAFGVAVSGDYAYVADSDSGLQVIDISDPTNPVLVGSCDTPDDARDVAISGLYAYVADGYSGLQVIDISDPTDPALAGSCDTPGEAGAWGVTISGDHAYVAYVAHYDGGLQVINISDPTDPTSAGSYTTEGHARDVAVSGDYAYVAHDVYGLQVIDVSNPGNPAPRGSYDTPGYSWGVAVSGDYVYVANLIYGLHVFDVTDPDYPALAGGYDTGESGISVAVRGHHIYLGTGGGLDIIAFLSSGGFGACVAMDRDVLVASAPCAHAAYAYAREGDTWREVSELPTAAGGMDVSNGHFPVGDRVGTSVDVYYKKTPAPTSVTASAGDFEDRVRIEWQDDSPLRSSYEGAFGIYRDGQLIESLGPTARSYNDFSAEPGRTYEYGVTGYWEALGESDAVLVYGRRPADGAVSGRVTSRGGAGLESVMVYLDPPPNSALLFDGAASYVEVEDPVFPADSLTMEFWVKGNDSGRDGWVMCYADGPDLSQALLGIGDIRNLRVRIKDAETGSTGVGVDDGWWHHIAVTWRTGDGRLEIFKDGESAYDTTGFATDDAIPRDGTLIFGQNPWEGFDEYYALAGQLDEVRIWQGVRTPDEIAGLRKQPLSGRENNLVAYWPFDEGIGRYATADLTGNNAYGALEGAIRWTSGTDSLEVSTSTDLEGSYAITGIRYGASSTLKVIPFMERRTFEPGFRKLILDPASPVGNEVGFTDVSSFTVAGRAYFEDTNCALENAEIWVDGELKGASDKEGNFKVAVDPGVHVIEPVFTDHTFAPASRETLVTRDMSGLDFEDTLVRSLSGRVGGGCDLSFGTLDIEIWAKSGCFDTTLCDVAGDYEVSLPPLKYFASVESVHVAPGCGMDAVDIERFFETLGVREIDLADSAAQIDFTYLGPLAVEIEGLPEVLCEEIADEERGTVIPAVPIIGQGEGVRLIIRVVSDYGDSGTCLVDTGTVTIFDEIMDAADQPVTLPLERGIAVYETYGGYPNIFYGRTDADGNDRSYQKALTVVANVEGRAPVRETRWVMVTGDLPRTGTFVSATTEEFPLLILRDPPGDGSYSFVERGRTVTTRFSDIVCSGTTGSAGFAVKAGIAHGVAVGVSAFGATWSISTQFAAWRQTDSGWEWGVRATNEGAMELSLTSTEHFSTSSSDLFVGPEGDVYLGVAMNLIFAKTDVIGIDQSSEPCKVVKSETVRFGVDGEEPFETIYLYTQDHIESTLIPQYENLAEIEPDRAAEFEGYIANWQSHLDRNDSLRTLALESPRENRSFSAGATLEFTETKDSTATYATAFEVFSSDEAAVDLGFEAAGWGVYAFGALLKAQSTTYTEATDTTDVLEVGYLLTDDDPGDYFSTDVATDPEYGTPVFGLKSGQSSCPWEPGTQPRDSLFMTIQPDSLEGVPPEEPAEFKLGLTNASVSEETREYVLYPVQTSNLGGALLGVNGESLHDGLSFTIPPDRTQEATLTVERGPSKYYYRDLKLVLVSACDPAVADTVTFSVAFAAPCSDITLHSPQPGWAFNLANSQITGDSLDLILSDFEMRVSQYDSLLLVGAEYRPADTDEAVTIGDIARENITLNPDGTPQSQHIPWDLSAVDDGRYEVRAYTQCSSGGPVSSSYATGTIDRARPTPFGAPQPADGELALGDEVSVTFNEPIRCSSVNPVNITLECMNPDSGSPEVGFDVTCNGSRVVISPDIADLSMLEGKTLRASVAGVKDLLSNPMVARDSTSTETWEFEVRRSAFVWSEADVIHGAAYRYAGSFTAELVNGTAEAIDFSLTGVPDWLTPDATSGSLFSEESEEIVFAIPDTLGIGTYQDTLYAEVEGAVPEIRTPLRVTVKVACQAPVWALDLARFEHSMSIVAELEIGGQASEDTSDMVAAYVGNELRGVDSPTFDPNPAYDHLVYLTVYSNRTGGETIRFQVWDNDSCRLYTNTDRFFTFAADGHIGDPESPEVIAASDTLPGLAQIVELSDGWTWFSLNLADLDMSVNGVLADLNASADDLIKSQTEFSTFDPDLGWVGSLTDLDNVSSYAISMSQVGTLIHEGTAVDADTVPMPGSAGWHWIGYVPEGGLDVGDALADLTAPHDLVKSQDEFAQVNVLGSWVGSLETMEPGQGYRLWLGGDRGTWYYPGDSSGIPLANLVTSSEEQDTDKAHWSVDAHAYEHSMSLIGQLQIDGAIVSDDKYLVGAFVDGEVRGVAPLQHVPQLDRYLAFLMIYSNEADGESVTFQAYDEAEDRQVGLNETVAFAADEAVGLLGSPYVFTGDLGDTTGLPVAFSLGQNSPNPLTSSGEGLIGYGLPRSAHVLLKVYDVRGREVTTLVDREQPAGWHYVEVDPADFAVGIYFYRMNAGGFVSQRKMTVLR